MREIVQRFAEEGYMIDPEALELIASYPGPIDELVDGVIRGLGPTTLVVGAPDVQRCSCWINLVGADGLGQRSPTPSDRSGSDRQGSPDLPKAVPASALLGHPIHPEDAIPSASAGAVPAEVGGVFSYPPSELYRPKAASNPEFSSQGAPPPEAGLSPVPLEEGAGSPSSPRPKMGGGSSRLEDVIGPGLGFGPGSSAPEDLHLLVPPATLASPAPSNLEALRDITGRSTCVGEYQDFVRYFRDRYSRIREILAGRLNARPIDSLRRGDLAGREISVIGMVMEVRTSAKGNRVVELEDPTGMVTAIFQKGVPGSEEVESLVPDEVVGVTGTTDGKGRFFAKALLRPDLEARSAVACGEGGALLLSDVHVGSTYFMEDAWDRFIGWICGEMDDPLGIASTVRYAVIAGDLVDGIGIYPGQEGDLAIKDVWEQYERAAELVSEIPDRIQIVISPGNHDVVRQAEPQPALPEGLRPLFRGNVTFVGNPAAFRLGGVDWLVYHGRSIDDLVLKIPGLSYAEPEKAMVEMLKRRHLSPIYGNRVSIAPEEEDLLVIRRPPGILHSGHVHTVGMARYKGVTAINSGTWQSQTDFQKKMNIQPTPAIVPYLDLSTMRARRLIFA
ncbi:MAG: DNA-directed DNA polymerase II small subunit [Methanothrix sp.]|jgi:DNA polymerase II small subunit|nr:DNA-directed DNA polymerase II small subunit [Methanothrix sp.]HNT72265.1 DNA-directed DNA polymerase II small subunit [Methanothrix sp.]HOI69123.1 DNA-directed DNA polymerase II small subunit [Methanothrix sp.]HPY71908.1 DNA-directed DNA polymerase II small subunit [Methanothrix sp.]HQA63162.1 DNA-directed DNA polymerase II small subunit [Methanothrix sp.]